jgi:cholest-4-en-3-one 26-monooxygenase
MGFWQSDFAASGDDDLSRIDVHSVAAFVRRGYPWAEWDLLRREAPAYWYERPGIDPFWCITRHEDIYAIGLDCKTFVNSGPQLRVTTIEMNARMWDVKARRDARYGWDPDEPFDMLFLDDPRHQKFRRLLAREFTPARCRAMATALTAHARRFVGEFIELLDRDGEADLVEDLAVKLPLATICEMMGSPADDWSSIHRWTDSKFPTDSTAWARPGESREDMRRRLRQEHFEYFDELIARSRAHPGDDLASILVNATIDG